MSPDGATGGSASGRPSGGSPTRWLLLGASRLAVTALVLSLLFAGIVAVLLGAPAAFDRAVAAGDPVQTLFQALVAAIVTGVTLVVSINSLVLSQELGPAGAQREKMDEAVTFRDEVAELIGSSVAPADPARFLRALLAETDDTAARLRGAVGEQTPATTRRAMTEYAEGVERDAGLVDDQLADAEFGTFAVVAGSLGFDYSAKLYEGRRLRGQHEDALDADARDHLRDLLALLHRFGPAREHVKTLYFQWELVALSRSMLYAALPALVVGVTGVLVLGDPGIAPGRTAGLANHAWIVAGAATVTLWPFAILFSYILRIGTVAKRTLAIGPFRLHGGADGAGDGGSE